MNNLFTSIRFIVSSRNFGIPDVILPKEPELEKAYQKVKKKLGDGGQIKHPEKPEVWIQLAQETFLRNNWQNRTRQELRNIGLCLWLGETPLAENMAFLKKFLATCTYQNRKSLCRAIIFSYLNHYSHRNKAIKLIGNWLSSQVMNWDWHWADREKELLIFSDDNVPRTIMQVTLNGTQPVAQALEACGLSGTLHSSGMAQSAFREALVEYQDIAKNEDSHTTQNILRRIIEWATIGQSKFTYPKLKVLFIESLLMPWSKISVANEVKITTQSMLINSFHDPRIAKGDWIGVKETALQVIRGWLVERALMQFLDVVDEFAHDHQWKYRRAFWLAYYKKGYIREGWVAFARNGARKSVRLAEKNDDPSWYNFAKLDGAGDHDHAVLILQIGDVIVADFSHNGKCRIWDGGNDNRPNLYKESYRRAQLMYGNADHEFTHTSSPYYTWQKKVSSAIADLTNLRLSQAEYRA